MAHAYRQQHGIVATIAMAVLLVGLINGCTGGGGQSFFMVNKNTQAIQRDTITASGAQSTLQNPQDSIHGVIKLAPVETLGLTSVQLATNGISTPPFDVPHTLMVPPGFSVSVLAAGLGRPRELALRDDGTLFFTEFGGKVMAISPDRKQTTIADGLKSPHGIELVNGALYYTDEFHLYRFEFSSPTAVTGTSKVLTDKLPPGGMHYTRAIRWVPNDKRLYISIGSSDNKRVEDDNQHATMLRVGEQGGVPDAATRGGLRDVVAMDVHPASGDLWAIDNGTDLLSPVLPPTEINVIKVGKHYGWPFFYSQNFRDPEYDDASTATYSRFPTSPTPPIVELEAHAEMLGMRFYRGTAFGSDWNNAMIITCHATPKVLRVRANADGTNARQADFITGFTNPDSKSLWGTPVGVAVSRDGRTVYISDDRAGAIYVVTSR